MRKLSIVFIITAVAAVIVAWPGTIRPAVKAYALYATIQRARPILEKADTSFREASLTDIVSSPERFVPQLVEVENTLASINTAARDAAQTGIQVTPLLVTEPIRRIQSIRARTNGISAQAGSRVVQFVDEHRGIVDAAMDAGKVVGGWFGVDIKPPAIDPYLNLGRETASLDIGLALLHEQLGRLADPKIAGKVSNNVLVNLLPRPTSVADRIGNLLAQDSQQFTDDAPAMTAQQTLHDLGYLDHDDVDGKFGPFSRERLALLEKDTETAALLAGGCTSEVRGPALARALKLLVSGGYLLDNPRMCNDTVVGAANAFQVDLKRRRS